jgi:hypothetical protein
MEQESEDLKRAVRTAIRTIEAARGASQTDHHLVAAVQQLAFAVDKLIDMVMRAKRTQN